MFRRFRLYAKYPTMRTFRAVDWRRGTPTCRLLFATIFTPEEGKTALLEARSMNPEAHFKLVELK